MNQHPKRRKYKDNNYELINLGKKYFVHFKDGMNKTYSIEISKQIYQTMSQFELDDIKMLHEFERHIEHSNLYEETLYKRVLYKEEALENIVIRKCLLQELNQIISSLPYQQQKRILLYFFQNLSLEEIAKVEGTSHQAISKSIKNGLSKIQKLSKISYDVQ